MSVLDNITKYGIEITPDVLDLLEEKGYKISFQQQMYTQAYNNAIRNRDEESDTSRILLRIGPMLYDLDVLGQEVSVDLEFESSYISFNKFTHITVNKGTYTYNDYTRVKVKYSYAYLTAYTLSDYAGFKTITPEASKEARRRAETIEPFFPPEASKEARRKAETIEPFFPYEENNPFKKPVFNKSAAYDAYFNHDAYFNKGVGSSGGRRRTRRRKSKRSKKRRLTRVKR